MRRIKIYVLLFFLFQVQVVFGQLNYTMFEQLDSLQQAEKRPVVVYLYTDWCKYCGTMKNTTFKNEAVIKLLNENFYFVSFNIEEKNPISFSNYTFQYKPTGNKTGIHELAEQLGTINGQLAYPGLCFLNSKFEILHQQEGFVSAKELLLVLNQIISMTANK
jgi:thioredoxin-related protein